MHRIGGFCGCLSLSLVTGCRPLSEKERPTGAGDSTAVQDSGERVSVSPEPLGVRRYSAADLGLELSGDAGFTGPGVAIVDLDGDDDLDVVWVSPLGAGMVLVNDGSGALAAGQELPGGAGVSAADVDGDGRPELVIVGIDGDFLARGSADGGLELERLEPDSFALASSAASFADVDGDGDLDLFLATYVRSLVLPLVEDGLVRGESSRLYRNDGGTYVRWEDTLPEAAEDGLTFHGVFFDPSGGVEPWLYLVNDFGGLVVPNQLLQWGGEGYVDRSTSSGADLAMFNMGAGIGDPDEDGDPDVFLTNINRSHYLRNMGDGAFADAGSAEGLEVGGPGCDTSWGAVFVDVDLDGWEDLAVTCGQLMPSDHEHREDLLNLETELGHPVDPSEQPDVLFHNQRGSGWQDVSASVGFDDPGINRTVAVGDLDRDGRPDLVTAAPDSLTVHLNPGGPPGITVRLEDPRVLNRQAFGARLVGYLGDRELVRWMLPTSQASFSASAPEVIFGLDGALSLDRLTVTWPDGTLTEHGPFARGERVTLSP